MIATTQEPETGLTFEKVWAALMEDREQMKAMREEADRRSQEMDRYLAEAVREMKETRQETERALKKSGEEVDQRIGRLGSRLGELIEALTASNLVEKINALGFQFDHLSRNHEIRDKTKKLLAEIDILLEDGAFAMAVEVKTNLTKGDVMKHLHRMNILRRNADSHEDKRKYVSAIAGVLIKDGAKDYALNQGMYVIEHPGQTIEILAPPKRREW